MSNITVTFNTKSTVAEIMSNKNRASVIKAIGDEIDPMLDRKQEELIERFVTHPVTQEIKGGISSSNITGTTGGYGNLFSFIGFESGSSPTEVIEAILKQKIKFKIRGLNPSGRFKLIVQYSSEKEIFEKTPMPWASGMSWAEGVEAGISNLGSFLYSTSGRGNTRSGGGLQTKNDRGRKFNTTPYISELMKDFKKELKRLDK